MSTFTEEFRRALVRAVTQTGSWKWRVHGERGFSVVHADAERAALLIGAAMQGEAPEKCRAEKAS